MVKPPLLNNTPKDAPVITNKMQATGSENFLFDYILSYDLTTKYFGYLPQTIIMTDIDIEFIFSIDNILPFFL